MLKTSKNVSHGHLNLLSDSFFEEKGCRILLLSALASHCAWVLLSFIFQVLERDGMVKRFQDVTTQLDQALDAIPFEELQISEEVREQVYLNLESNSIPH